MTDAGGSIGGGGESYPGGAASLIAHWEQRRDPLDFGPGEALPPLDTDLARLAATPIPAGRPKRGRSGYAAKRRELMVDLAGQSELALLHGLVIASLRKRSWPAHAPALFRRLWDEQADALLTELPVRWLISAAITFADHGATEADRRVGQSLNLLFSLMKLYEFERQFSGLAGQQAFGIGKRSKTPLPLGMPDFALATGGLDINMLAPIWAEALAAPQIGPLACHLLDTLNRDDGTLFRRLGTMRQALRQRRAAREAAKG